MGQPIKRYYIRRPDGSITAPVGKIFNSEDVSEDEIMNPEPEEEEQEQEQEEYEEPTEQYPSYEGETGEAEYERRSRKKKKKRKVQLFHKHPKAKRALKSFLYKRPKKKKAITWRPRLERHPKPRTMKFFKGKQQPARRSIIKRR
jgi:chromatin segregation and condensation protein Rec8/ScpA/Scc1 (kleisin family)